MEYTRLAPLALSFVTKPVWWWERTRSFSIRSRYQQLPPLPVEGGRLRFVVLTAPETLNDALWTAWSWFQSSPNNRYLIFSKSSAAEFMQ